MCNCAILKGFVPLSWRINSHTPKARLHWGCAKCCHVRRGVSTYTSGSQTFMSRGPLLSLTGEYLIYRDTWVMQYHGIATLWKPLLVSPREPLRGHQGGWGHRLRNPDLHRYIGLHLLGATRKSLQRVWLIVYMVRCSFHGDAVSIKAMWNLFYWS